MPHRFWLAALVLAVAANTSAAQRPGAGPKPRPSWDQPSPRRHEEQERNREWLDAARAGAQSARNLRPPAGPSAGIPRTGDVPRLGAPAVKPSTSWGRGWLTGIGAALAALFGAIFRSRQ